VKEDLCEPRVPVPVQGVCYQVRNRADKRQRLAILSQVSAYFNPSEMAAVMGPSGSGAHCAPAHLARPKSDSAAAPAVLVQLAAHSHWHSRCAAASTGSAS
jgi:predicted ABC-type transport system involved in lysophospholipase L1 biosynthesis ATPase subunit